MATPVDSEFLQMRDIVLKEEQRVAVEALLPSKDVMAVLPTGFGKSMIYQSFALLKIHSQASSCYTR